MYKRNKGGLEISTWVETPCRIEAIIISTIKLLALVSVPDAVHDDDDAVAVVGAVEVGVCAVVVDYDAYRRPVVCEVAGCKSRTW